MLQLGLRVGTRPRALVTTIPRPGPVLKGIMAEPGTIRIGGPSDSNPHDSPVWTASMRERYAGTGLERQELDGELLTDALWEFGDRNSVTVHLLWQEARKSGGQRARTRGVISALSP